MNDALQCPCRPACYFESTPLVEFREDGPRPS